MAKKRKKARDPEAPAGTTSKNAFKIASIAIAVIFIAIIAWGIVRSHYFTSAHAVPTESQIAAAKAAVVSALEQKGDSLSHYQFSAAKRTRGWSRSATNGMLEVFAYSNATLHTYLVDVNSSAILAHAQFEFFGNDTARRNSYFEEMGAGFLKDER